MEREKKYITKVGSYTFGNNYNLIFRDKNIWLNDCNIICENNCLIDCHNNCNITCGDECVINCGNNCNITCGNDCEIKCAYFCYIKAGERSKIEPAFGLLKTISKDEEFIWWYAKNLRLTNTYKNEDWKKDNIDKWNEFYGFVHNELDSATLF